LRRIAQAVVKALKSQGHIVPYGVVLHALASADGQFDWHRLSNKASKEVYSKPDLEVLQALQSTRYCLKNWVDIADDEDLRDYDQEAIDEAARVLRRHGIDPGRLGGSKYVCGGNRHRPKHLAYSRHRHDRNTECLPAVLRLQIARAGDRHRIRRRGP